jgi:hypothetical protein
MKKVFAVIQFRVHGILSYDAVEYIKHEGNQIPPELSEFISIIKKGNKCPYKK